VPKITITALFKRQKGDLTMDKEEQTLDEFREEKRKKKAQMTAMQNLPYEIKVKRAAIRVREFIEKCDELGFNTHISVGGLDSITLLYFIRSLGYDIPAISVSGLEDKSIIKIHKEIGVQSLKPGKPKTEVLQEFGFPVLSKRIAGKIETLQHPTERNKTVRHAIITGECGAQGHFAKNSRMKLPQKWLELFAGYENENEGTNYEIAPFKVSNKCCLYMKEKPCDKWAKEHNSKPFLGLMASEGGQREDALVEHGCNYFGKNVIRSAPFAPFLRQDLLQLALDLNVPVPEIYGKIERKTDGTLYTTGAQRTGCQMCGFGVHMEKRPHRFDKLRQRNPKEWEFWMYKCCTDPDTGEKYGWGRVLNYIGVEWEDEYPEAAEQLELKLQDRKEI
jgi:3'-phosphoadenosine 5'-phosphosulfate sulfotransferase (PAPS reductase)/FAD synthetase